MDFSASIPPQSLAETLPSPRPRPFPALPRPGCGLPVAPAAAAHAPRGLRRGNFDGSRWWTPTRKDKRISMKLSLSKALLPTAALLAASVLGGAQIERLTMDQMVSRCDHAVAGETVGRHVLRGDHPVDGPGLYFTRLTVAAIMATEREMRAPYMVRLRLSRPR